MTTPNEIRLDALQHARRRMDECTSASELRAWCELAIELAQQLESELDRAVLHHYGNQHEPIEPGDGDVDELALSVRADNGVRAALKSHGLPSTIGALCQLTRTDLLNTHNLGRRSVREIELALGKRGRSLRQLPKETP